MKIKTNVIAVLAEMICGNAPYNAFMPYRSSSFLTKFFQEIDLPYRHDGSTRSIWVSSVLEELNDSPAESPYLPLELQKVILHLIDPDHFISVSWQNSSSLDQEKAIEKLNILLKSTGFQILRDPVTGQPAFSVANEIFGSTAVKRHEVSKVFTFVPGVFNQPRRSPQKDLVAVMMDFGAQFNPIFESIKSTVEGAGLTCERADDVWREPVIVQDIFELIFASSVVIVDFTGRNPNVMYETGIAHSFGKIVIPITQSLDDIPFDLRHHRALKYLPNDEGIRAFSRALHGRLDHIFSSIT